MLQYEKHLEAAGQKPSHEFFKDYASPLQIAAASVSPAMHALCTPFCLWEPLSCASPITFHAQGVAQLWSVSEMIEDAHLQVHPGQNPRSCVCRMAAGVAAGEVDKLAETKVRTACVTRNP